MTEPYKDIKHCIHCDLSGFDTFEDVLQHVRDVHMKLKPGDNLEELDGYD